MVTIPQEPQYETGSVDMHSIIQEVKNNVLPNVELNYKLRYHGENIWTLRIRRPNSNRRAKIEIIVDEYEDPEDRGARGAIFSYGDIPPEQLRLIMDSIMERI
jgi:hypothetical protein